MNCLQFPLGSFLKIHFPWSKPGGFIAASMLARHVWCGNFTVTLGIHTGSKQRVTREWILKFTWDLKQILFALKAQRFVVYSELSSVWPKMTEILRASERTGACPAQTRFHTNTSIAHISLGKHHIERPCKVATTYIFQMKSHIWGWWMIAERLDVLPDCITT